MPATSRAGVCNYPSDCAKTTHGDDGIEGGTTVSYIRQSLGLRRRENLALRDRVRTSIKVVGIELDDAGAAGSGEGFGLDACGA